MVAETDSLSEHGVWNEESRNIGSRNSIKENLCSKKLCDKINMKRIISWDVNFIIQIISK